MADELDPDEPENPDDPVPGGRGGVTSRTVTASGDQGIDGLLSGVAWNSGTLTYSFPDVASIYGTSDGTGPDQYPDISAFSSFSPLSAVQEADVQRALALISSYTNLQFDLVAPTAAAVLRFANTSTVAAPTAHAYYPSIDITGGDVWFGGTGQDPVMGNFDSGNAVLHEIGHALGLKHGQETDVFGAVPANLLSNEYSLMNYPAYVGAPSSGSSTIGPGSSPQTYMMYDIAALQYMYGANFGNVGITQTYTWDPNTGQEFINNVGQGLPYNNHIFMTVWTGGATATYNLSNFNQNATLDLRPGAALLFSTPQLADLGYYSADGPGTHLASGNVYNALLYNGDTRSEVSGLVTGNGNDSVFGNDVFDTITLGSGNDTVTGGSGGGMFNAGTGSDMFIGGSGPDFFNLGALSNVDVITGGSGNNNTVILSGDEAAYTPSFNSGTLTITSTTDPSDVANLTNVQTLQFADATISAASLECFAAGSRIATPDGLVPVEQLRKGDLVLVASGDALPVVWLGHRRVDCGTHPHTETVWPIRIAANAFGADEPIRELLLSPDHAVFVEGVLIPVKYLLNGTSIRQIRLRMVTYYHVELPRHDVILAEGLSVESYLNVGSRENFANGGWTIRMHPDFAMRAWEAAGCAPLVVSGPELAAAQRRLREAAARVSRRATAA